MNIKVKAAMDTAVMVGVCMGLSGLFAVLLNYVPMVALLIAVSGMTYVVYKFNLNDLKHQQEVAEIEKKIAAIKE